MTNEFANINAESNLSSMITLSIEETNEANAWFDERNEADYWMDSMNEE